MYRVQFDLGGFAVEVYANSETARQPQGVATRGHQRPRQSPHVFRVLGDGVTGETLKVRALTLHAPLFVGDEEEVPRRLPVAL